VNIRGPIRTVAVICLLGENIGCSVLFVRTPANDVSDAEATRTAPDCTSSSTLPVLDVTGVAASGVNMAIVGSSDRYTEDQKEILVPLHAVYGALYAASAVYGFYQTGKCRKLKDKFEREGSEWTPALKEGPKWTPALKSDPPKPSGGAPHANPPAEGPPKTAPGPAPTAFPPP